MDIILDSLIRNRRTNGIHVGKEQKMTELERALTHIKTRADAWAVKEVEDALSQEPCDDIAQERYKDLCEYFGGAKDILKSREDFKAWLGRIKWHIRKAEELYEKYENKQEPCTDAVSRQAVLDRIRESIETYHNQYTTDMLNMWGLFTQFIKEMPSVRPQEPIDAISRDALWIETTSTHISRQKAGKIRNETDN